MIVGPAAFGTDTRESVAPSEVPSMSNSTFMLLLPGPAVMWYPTDTQMRSVAFIVMSLAPVVQVTVYQVCNVLMAVVPFVGEHSEAPDPQFSPAETRGNTVPLADVFFIHKVKVKVELAGMIPPSPGTPACVSNDRRNASSAP